MVKPVYTKELLNEILTKSGARLKGDVNNTTKRSQITFFCHCGEERTKSFETMKRNGAYCDKHQLEILQKKRKENLQKKYGEKVTDVSKIPGFKEKRDKTMLKKYGTTVFFKTDEYKQVRVKYHYVYLIKLLIKSGAKYLDYIGEELNRESNILFVCKCGNEGQLNFRNIEKIGATCFEERNIISVEKTQQTMLDKYGVKNAQHDPTLFEKGKNNAYMNKEYVFPSGKKIEIQGYEHFALNDLLKEYTEDDIKVGREDRLSKELPSISYTFDEHNKKYYPDIYIKSINKLIEVKSDFTFKLHKDQNIAKQNECIKQGYDYEFYIYNKKGERIFID